MANLTLAVTSAKITPGVTAISRDGSLTVNLSGLDTLGEAITTGELHVKQYDAFENILGEDVYAVAESVNVTIRAGVCSLSFRITSSPTYRTAHGGIVAILSEFPVEIDGEGGAAPSGAAVVGTAIVGTDVVG